MHEIVIVKPWLYPAGATVGCRIFDKNGKVLWWFADSSLTPEKVSATSTVPDFGFNSPEVDMPCEAIRFEFDFCPNPWADHFSVSGLYDEAILGGLLGDLFIDDLPRLAEIVKRKRATLSPDDWRYLLPESFYFFALYEVEFDEFRDDDGGLDAINVIPTFIGELDIDRIAELVVKA